MSKAPQPTDPKETSAAQTGSSVSTSIANAFLTNMNETGPDGTKTFSQSGDYNFTDPYTGENYDIPRFSVETTLSDQQQQIKDQQDGADLNLATLGSDLSGTLGKQLTGNFELGNEATESRLFELGSTRLSNQGIKAGSDAFDREMGNLNEGRNDAYNQLLLQGRGQASQEMLTEDNQRINQISALLSNGQVSMPNFTTSSNVQGIRPTDNAAIIGNYDNGMINSWQQTQAARGSAIGGIGGLFSLL